VDVVAEDELSLLLASLENARKYRTSPRTPTLPRNAIRPTPTLPAARVSSGLSALLTAVPADDAAFDTALPLVSAVFDSPFTPRSVMTPMPPETYGCHCASPPSGTAPMAFAM